MQICEHGIVLDMASIWKDMLAGGLSALVVDFHAFWNSGGNYSFGTMLWRVILGALSGGLTGVGFTMWLEGAPVSARGAVNGFVAAFLADFDAFKTWEGPDVKFNWKLAAMRWCYGAVLGATGQAVTP